MQQLYETIETLMISQSHWKKLGRELTHRSVDPWNHPSFAMYFLLAVLGAGAAGIWLEVYRVVTVGSGLENLRAAIHTFFPVLIATTGLQLIWAEGSMRSLRAFAAFIMALCVVGWIISTNIHSNIPSLIIGGIFSVLAVWLWLITNAKQQDFLDINDDAPLGGKVSRPLKGDLSGFED